MRTKAPLFKRFPSCTSTKYILGRVFSLLHPSPGANHMVTNSSEAPWDWHCRGSALVTGWALLPSTGPLCGRPASPEAAGSPGPRGGLQGLTQRPVWNSCTTWADSMNDSLFPLWTVLGVLLGVNNWGKVKSFFPFHHNQFSKPEYRTGNLQQ